MKIGATILSGGNNESVILGAADSVATFVDLFICIDTGASAQAAIQLMRDHYGDRVVVVRSDQDPYERCSLGRDQCFREAIRLGCDWMVMLDTDMRIECSRVDVRKFLSETTSDVVGVKPNGEWGPKPMLFRMPPTGSWQDDPHEWYNAVPSDMPVLPDAYCWETAKSPEKMKARCQYVIDRMIDMPESPRTFWYLAEAYDGLGLQDKAIETWFSCAAISRADWAAHCYWNIAKAHLAAGRIDAMIGACNLGIQVCSGYPEFDWLAGVGYTRKGCYDLAVQRAAIAIRKAKDAVNGSGGHDSWSYKAAWYDGPYDVLRWALTMLSVNTSLTDSISTECDRQRHLRLNAENGVAP